MCHCYAPDVALPDEYSSMVYAFCQTDLENLCLQPSLQEIFNLEGQHVIESHTGLIEHTNADKSADKRITLKQPFGVFGIEFQKFTSGTTDFGQNEGDAPDLAFVTETVFSSKLGSSAVCPV